MKELKVTNPSTATIHKAYEMLRELRANPALKGHDYIIWAIALILDNDEGYFKRSVMSLLYGSIAAKFKTTIGSVERNIRTSIANIFRKGSRKALEDVFGNDDEMTNIKFLNTLALHIKYNSKEEVL